MAKDNIDPKEVNNFFGFGEADELVCGLWKVDNQQGVVARGKIKSRDVLIVEADKMAVPGGIPKTETPPDFILWIKAGSEQERPGVSLDPSLN